MSESGVDKRRLLATFLELLGINSTARREGIIAKRVRDMLERIGCEVTEDNAAEQLGSETGNLIARLPGDIDAPAILFCAHLDTVAPTTELKVQRKRGIISSDGTTILGADDKAGLAAILEMLRAVLDSGMRRPPLEIVFTIAEEIGVMGSMALDYPQLSARYGFIPDTSGPVGLIVTNAPAQKHLDITVHGRAAHAGMAPEEGISAITVASRAIACVRQGRVDEETTANIGVIRGGKATNIVPDSVEIEGEARSRNPQKLDEQVAHMRSCFLEAAQEAGATANVEVSDVYPAFNLDAESMPVKLASRALTAMGINPVVTATGGGSDANFLNGYGIQTVILSTGYHHPHCTDEYIEEDQLVRLTELLTHIVRLASEE